MSTSRDPYEYRPAYERHPILDIPRSSARKDMIEAVLANSYQDLASWPPDLDNATGPRVQDVVKEIEQGPKSIEEKNAIIIGMMAVTSELDYADNMIIDEWQLAPHLGMLDAIGAALAAGLVLSPESLRMAAVFHREHSKYDSLRELDDPYASPEIESAVHQIQGLMQQYGTLHEDSGVETFIEYYTHCIDDRVYYVVPGQECIKERAEDDAYKPMLDAYNHILAQILETRQALIDQEDRLGQFWEQQRTFHRERHNADDEAEEQDLQPLPRPSQETIETVSLPDGQKLL